MKRVDALIRDQPNFRGALVRGTCCCPLAAVLTFGNVRERPCPRSARLCSQRGAPRFAAAATTDCRCRALAAAALPANTPRLGTTHRGRRLRQRRRSARPRRRYYGTLGKTEYRRRWKRQKTRSASTRHRHCEAEPPTFGSGRFRSPPNDRIAQSRNATALLHARLRPFTASAAASDAASCSLIRTLCSALSAGRPDAVISRRGRCSDSAASKLAQIVAATIEHARRLQSRDRKRYLTPIPSLQRRRPGPRAWAEHSEAEMRQNWVKVGCRACPCSAIRASAWW